VLVTSHATECSEGWSKCVQGILPPRGLPADEMRFGRAFGSLVPRQGEGPQTISLPETSRFKTETLFQADIAYLRCAQSIAAHCNLYSSYSLRVSISHFSTVILRECVTSFRHGTMGTLSGPVGVAPILLADPEGMHTTRPINFETHASQTSRSHASDTPPSAIRSSPLFASWRAPVLWSICAFHQIVSLDIQIQTRSRWTFAPLS